MQLNSGIYKLYFKDSCKFYIGSSKNIIKRFSEHKNRIIQNKHSNKYLQNLCLKLGVDKLKYEILANCPSEYLLKDLLQIEKEATKCQRKLNKI